MGIEDIKETLSLFNMGFLSSVTAMVLAVNLITQVIKEVFLPENIHQRIPKIITLLASVMVVAVGHYTQWINHPAVFHNSVVELIFLIFINSILIAALSMGNYKVLNLTKERELKKVAVQIYQYEKQQQKNQESVKGENGELY